jgi:hypothetical protein
MLEHNSPSPSESLHPPVNPLPIALYVSGQLIYELYDGGQPERKFSIRWERLAPIEQRQPEAAPESLQNTHHTRQDQCPRGSCRVDP